MWPRNLKGHNKSISEGILCQQSSCATAVLMLGMRDRLNFNSSIKRRVECVSDSSTCYTL